MRADPAFTWVQLSGENLALARAELAGALRALGGDTAPEDGATALGPDMVRIVLPRPEDLVALASRLALGRRVLREVPSSGAADLSERIGREGAKGGSASFRALRAGRAPLATPQAHSLAAAYRSGGGTIDLGAPHRRFRVWEEEGSPVRAFEEVGSVDRAALQRRRMPRLAYQRPVSLPPKLGRVAANLASVRPGDRVVDPFVGTGALLLEAALLGARVSGGDQSVEMVRGALRNLSSLGISADELRVGDAGEAFPPRGGGGWDAVLTDPPYGRASGSRGEPPQELLRRVLPRWADLVRPGGAVAVVLPGGPDPLPEPWVRAVSVPDRVHRSLTREFRVYRRSNELD